MQLTTYHEITTQLVGALKIEEIIRITDRILTHSTNENAAEIRQNLISAVHAARDHLYHLSKDPEVASVTEAVGLNQIFGSSTLTELVLALHSQNSTHELRGSVRAFRAMAAFYWPLKAFAAQTAALQSVVVAGRNSAPQEEILEFDVLELGQVGFDPDRTAAIIPAVEKLFKGVSLSLSAALPTVRIVYVDSGSSLLLAFKAAPALVKEVRLLLSDMLVTVRDWRAEQKSKQIKVAMEGLDFCRKLQKAENEGLIPHEQAAQAKHLTMAAAVQLVKLGVVPRGEKNISIDPRMLVERAAQIAVLPAPSIESDKPPSQ